MRIGLSRSAQYAIRGILRLSKRPHGATVKELSKEEGLPHDFLSKVFQALTRKKLLHSNKGPGGGFRLAVPLSRLSLKKVIEAVDGPLDKGECFLGLKRCIGIARPCPVHRICEKSARWVSSILETTTLYELANTRR